MRTLRIRMLPVAAVTLLAACTHVLRSEATPKLGAARYTATSMDSIRVIDFSRPMRFRAESVAVALGDPFEQLGDVEAYGPGKGPRGREVALESLRRRAAELGATAIVLNHVGYPPPYTAITAEALRQLPPMPDAAARCDTLLHLDATVAVALAVGADTTYAWPAAHIDDAMRVLGDSAKAYRRIGYLIGSRNHLLELQNANRGGAVAAYREAIRLTAADPAPYYEQGEELLERKRYDEALANYAAMARRWPESARVWSRVGVAYNRLGRHVDAMRARQRALDLKPRYFGGMLTLDVEHEYSRYRESEHHAGKQPAMTVDALP